MNRNLANEFHIKIFICQLVVHFIDIEPEYASEDDCESNSNSNQ